MEKNDPSVRGLSIRPQISPERTSASVPFPAAERIETAVLAARRMTLESVKTISALESPQTETVSPTRTESPAAATPPSLATSPSVRLR